ncbi:nucleolar zinc-finger protein [Teratosphaeriaceae sp. CCFEE 6253]|nr:nucleolar zinc-finger protein [Teratosphaeriaceae sp. CCFEE 6253]
MEQMPEVGEKIAGIIQTLTDMAAGRRLPFMISADDPSGNSWIEWTPGDAAGKWAKSEYNRTATQNGMLGLGDDVPPPGHEHHIAAAEAPETELRPEYHAQDMVGTDNAAPAPNNVDLDNTDIVEDQVYSFPASCPGCTRPCATNMKMVNIPYFKQVVLMSTVCESCGYRSNEVKTGGEVPEKGRKITLQVRKKEDLSRDILKSESAALVCPELQLRVEPGTMGGRFTTVEGILNNIRKDLRGQAFGLEDGDAVVPEGAGDSMPTESKRSWEDFFNSLGDAIEGRKPFTLTLEDPLASSYVQSLTAPEPDPQIEVQDYERTEEEMEDLGLNDIKTEGYEALSACVLFPVAVHGIGVSTSMLAAIPASTVDTLSSTLRIWTTPWTSDEPIRKGPSHGLADHHGLQNSLCRTERNLLGAASTPWGLIAVAHSLYCAEPRSSGLD